MTASLSASPARRVSPRTRVPTEPGAGVLALLVLATLPLDLGHIAGAFVAPADLIALALVPFALSELRSREGTVFAAAVFVGVTGILVAALGWNAPLLKPLISLGFYAKPWILFFAARKSVLRRSDPAAAAERLWQLLAYAALWTLAMVVAGRLVTGTFTVAGKVNQNLDVVGFSAGSWTYPVHLYAAGQVNSTAALLGLSIPLFAQRFLRSRGNGRFLWLLPIPLSVVAIAQSGSRTGLLFTLGFGLAWLVGVGAARRELRSLLPRLVVVAVGLLLVNVAFDFLLSSSVKYSQSITEIRSGNFSRLSSGRLDLARIMIDDIRRSPIFGTGFQNFARYHADSTWANSSPHDALLGSLHKGGLICGSLFLYLMLFVTLRPPRLQQLPLLAPVGLATIVILAPVIDVFTTSALSATLLIMLGAGHGAAPRRERRRTSTA